jgi:uncharacterized protein with HEPN domain
MSFGPPEYLRHILAEAEFLLHTSQGVTADAFARDPVLQRAFVRSLEVIGEATKKLPPSYRNEHPEVEWRAMAGMRDHLIHGYFAVDYQLVWDVVTTKIPRLQEQVSTLLEANA